MPEILGEYVDRLVNIELKNCALPRGFMRQFYEAALAEGGGRPLTLRAAEGLIAKVHERDNVLILTGAGTPPAMPRGETDGPPGAAAIARALQRGLKALPILVSEERYSQPLAASSEAAGVILRSYAEAKEKGSVGVLLVSPAKQAEIPEWASSVFDQYSPKAVISTERLGPNEKGVLHGATGIQRSVMLNLASLIAEAEKRGIFSIGVGDNGNELGFGRIYETVREFQPFGRKCQCPCGGGMASVVKTDVLVPAFISNWGCYGVEAMLAVLLRQPELMHTPSMERKVITACLEAGGVDGISCTKSFSVDGVEGESSMAVVQLLGNMVRIQLAPPDRGAAH